MAKRRLSPAQRELVQLREIEIVLTQFVKVFAKPTQWYQPFRDAINRAVQERSLLERAMSGDAEAIRIRKLARNETSE